MRACLCARMFCFPARVQSLVSEARQVTARRLSAPYLWAQKLWASLGRNLGCRYYGQKVAVCVRLACHQGHGIFMVVTRGTTAVEAISGWLFLPKFPVTIGILSREIHLTSLSSKVVSPFSWALSGSSIIPIRNSGFLCLSTE